MMSQICEQKKVFTFRFAIKSHNFHFYEADQKTSKNIDITK